MQIFLPKISMSELTVKYCKQRYYLLHTVRSLQIFLPEIQPGHRLLTLMGMPIDLEVVPTDAYDTVGGTHNMAGKDVIAAMDAKFAETNARFENLRAELRIRRWLLGILVGFVAMLMTVVVALVLYLLPGDPAPTEVAVETAIAEELDPSAGPPTTDSEEAAEEDTQE